MWAEQIVLGLIGLSSGVAVAGGLFAFIVELGVVADLADRTHTAENLLLYEDSIALGGILGNALFCFQIRIPGAGFARGSICNDGGRIFWTGSGVHQQFCIAWNDRVLYRDRAGTADRHHLVV